MRPQARKPQAAPRRAKLLSSSITSSPIRPALALATGIAACAGCSGDDAPRSDIFDGIDGGAGTDSAGRGGSGGLNVGDASSGGLGGVLTEEPPCDGTRPDADLDQDGFRGDQGDCNDCTPHMNPGAFDYPDNGVDEDCNGTPDDGSSLCDDSVAGVDDDDPLSGARAIGICQPQEGDRWGLVGAEYVRADGKLGMNPLSHGLLEAFGPNVSPPQGARMLALSSGTARAPTDPGWQSPAGAVMGTTGPTPNGFPVPAPSCPDLIVSDPVANDSAGLELIVRAPTNANALTFDFTFYTFEFPAYICSAFNDFFVAILVPAPPQAQFGNVSFDNLGNPVSVNNGFLEVCEPQVAGGKQFPCPRGPGQLVGTGFDEAGANHAATGWLRTESPVTPGSDVRIRFAIWDAGDAILDSTVLIDNFQWKVGEGEKPYTAPVPQ